MQLLYDPRDDAYHERIGSQILYWLDDLDAAPLGKADPTREGFLFASARSTGQQLGRANLVADNGGASPGCRIRHLQAHRQGLVVRWCSRGCTTVAFRTPGW